MKRVESINVSFLAEIGKDPPGHWFHSCPWLPSSWPIISIVSCGPVELSLVNGQMELPHLENGGLQDQVLPFIGGPRRTRSTTRGLATGTSDCTVFVLCVALQ